MGPGAADETLIDHARAGDGEAFRELTDPYRRELQLHCYRILGSLQDAEDVLQETLLSAWRALDRFDGRSVRAWLYRIATNRCLNELRDAGRRPRPDPRSGQHVPTGSGEPFWLEPYPDLLRDDPQPGPEARFEIRESVALSFVAALQHLRPQPRAALVLRDVLGFSAAETAEILDTSQASVNSALQRARRDFRPPGGRDLAPAALSAAESALVDRFVDAFERGDIDNVVALLTRDARFAMPPEPVEFRGPQDIGALIEGLGFWGTRLKLVPTRANGQPAVAYYVPDPHASVLRAGGLLVLTLCQDQISHITGFGDKSLIARFGLPRTLDHLD